MPARPVAEHRGTQDEQDRHEDHLVVGEHEPFHGLQRRFGAGPSDEVGEQRREHCGRCDGHIDAARDRRIRPCESEGGDRRGCSEGERQVLRIGACENSAQHDCSRRMDAVE